MKNINEQITLEQVEVDGRTQSLDSVWTQVITMALQGLDWKAIAKKLGVNVRTMMSWVRDPRFRAMQSSMMEYLYAELSKNHVKWVDAAFNSLYEMSVNQEGIYSERVQLEASSKIIELVHANVNLIKVLEQNRLVINDYLEEKQALLGLSEGAKN